MTLFTSLGPSPDCMRLTQVTKYQERTGHAREATFSVLQRSFSLGWGLHGKVARMPHQSKERGGTVCHGCQARQRVSCHVYRTAVGRSRDAGGEGLYQRLFYVVG